MDERLNRGPRVTVPNAEHVKKPGQGLSSFVLYPFTIPNIN